MEYSAAPVEVGIVCDAGQDMLSFYTTGLGLRPRTPVPPSTGGIMRLSAGLSMVKLVLLPKDAPRRWSKTAYRGVTLIVADLDAVGERLGLESRADPNSNSSVLNTRDPDGNALRIVGSAELAKSPARVHVNLVVPDVDRVTAFYRDGLSMQCLPGDGSLFESAGVRLVAGNSQIGVTHGDDGPVHAGEVRTAGIRFVTVVVESAEESAANARACGGSVRRPARPSPGGFTIAIVEDPFGNEVELVSIDGSKEMAS